MDPVAALLIPELRWDRDHGFAHLADAVDDALALGVGGFVLRGGRRDAVASLIQDLQSRSRQTLLIGAEAERGAGQTIVGCTGLPPAAGLAALRDEDLVRRAARLTARELRALGVTWALAPCVDLALEPANPVVGSRSFGADAQKVSEWSVAWSDTCQAEGVLATAMHLPGIGRLTGDPALDGLSTIDAPGATLWGSDLLPFRALVDAGVATVLVSWVSYPRLDASATSAARSPLVLDQLMRGELGFEGLLVSDAPSQAAARRGDSEASAVVAAVTAGCDLVLAPDDVAGAAEALESALEAGRLHPDRVEAALERRHRWAEWGRGGMRQEATLDDVLWARQVSDTVVHAARGVFATVGPVVDVILVDDDADRAWGDPAGRFGPFLETLRAVGLGPQVVEGPTVEGRGAVLVAIRGEPAAGRGRAGYREETRRRVARAVSEARVARRSVLAVVFGPPALVAEIPEVPNVICAWGGDRAMQEAAARRLA